MAKSVVNIFGKLFTFLRRPQPGEEVPPEKTEPSTQPSAEPSTEPSVTPSPAPEVTKSHPSVVRASKLTDSTASSDWEHVNIAANDSGTNIDIAMNLDGNDESNVKTENWETTDKKPLVEEENVDAVPSASSSTSVKSDTASVEASTVSEEPHTTPDTVNQATGGVEDTVPPPGGVEDTAPPPDNVGADIDKTGDEQIKDGQKDKKHKKKKVCQYYIKGLDCWKGKKCRFSHSRQDIEEHGESARDSDAPKPVEKRILESEFESYLDFVCEMTLHSKQVQPKDLLYKLGYVKDGSQDTIGPVVIGQYKLAVSKDHWFWVKEARYYAELLFPGHWIDENLSHKDVRSGRKNRPAQNKRNKNREERSTGMCRDIRLETNPDIQIVTANAAGDNTNNNSNNVDIQSTPVVAGNGDSSVCEKSGKSSVEEKGTLEGKLDEFVTDYTSQVLQEAMKVAIGEGLSESIIMEVIDDVAKVTDGTPHKRSKITKIDTTRTPRKRPEQLAMGFGYMSDVVVKESPKSAHGKIICLDTLPPPREPVDQLAVGFNNWSDALVKESPRKESGEIIIPGVTTTPRRLARDNLAMGFNFHSDSMALELSMTDQGDTDNTSSEIQDKNKGVPNGLGDSDVDKIEKSQLEEENNNNNLDKILTHTKKSSRKSIDNMYAVGFSYNSDIIRRESHDEFVDNNDVDCGGVNGLVEEDVTEGIKDMEINGQVQTGAPAGSVW